MRQLIKAETFKKLEDEVLEKEVRHDENVIDAKRGDIMEHEVQIKDDKSKMMKDLHEHEIKHDEKVIERKEHDAEKHDAHLKENEQEIEGK